MTVRLAHVKWKKARNMTIEIHRTGNEVWIYSFGTNNRSYAHLIDTNDGLVFNGDTELLKMYNGTRRGLIDDDKLDALYKSISGGVKPKD